MTTAHQIAPAAASTGVVHATLVQPMTYEAILDLALYLLRHRGFDILRFDDQARAGRVAEDLRTALGFACPNLIEVDQIGQQVRLLLDPSVRLTMEPPKPSTCLSTANCRSIR